MRQGDTRRYREIQGDTGRYREIQGDTGRYREIRGEETRRKVQQILILSLILTPTPALP